MISIIDYGAGNILSVEKALRFLGQEVEITDDRKRILAADHIILPGVGAFGDAMAKLRDTGLDKVCAEAVEKEIPFMGICLGLQLLFESSDESKGVEGLKLLKGTINRIPDKEGFKVPQIGWNSIKISEKSRLFKGIPQDSYVYFVHSYYLKAAEDIVSATTDYVVDIHAAVEKGNLFATQFHPEKSGDIGLEILKNFVSI